ncbi:MAG: DUF917 domain-containing protein [Candidatus Heimdallarchaeaceae archaeon]
MSIRTLTEEELEYLIIGAKILGTGGGGSEKEAKKMVQQLVKEGKKVRLCAIDAIPEEEMCAIVGIVGGGITERERAFVKDLETTIHDSMVEAAKKLEQYLIDTSTISKKGLYGFYATEMGPENIIIPLYVAAKLEKIAVDGDACGRSKPEIVLSTTNVYGAPITPLAIVSKYGDVSILESTVDDYRAETIVRQMAIISGGEVGCCRCPIHGKDLKNGAIIKGTITKAIKLGKNVVEAREKRKDLSEVISDTIEGKIIFKGQVEEFERIEKGGFVWGKIIFQGSEGTEYQNQQLLVDYKNEYLSAILEKEIIAQVPDSIIIIDSKTGEGLTPWEEDFKNKQRETTIIWKRAAEIWHTPKGLELFGLEHFRKEMS